MITIRRTQVDILAKEHAINLRVAQIKAFRAQSMQVEDSQADQTMTLTDPIGHQAKITTTLDGLTLTSGEKRSYHLKMDQHQQVREITDPAGLTISYQRDDNNCVTAISRGTDNITHFSHDEDSHLTQIKHPDQTQSDFEYDSDGKLIKKTDRNGQTTHYQYFQQGPIAQQVDRNGHITQFEYQGWDTPSVITFPNGDRHGFDYDEQGHLQQFTVNDQVHAEYINDEASGTFSVEYNDGTELVLIHQDDRLVEAKSKTGTLNLDYDKKGRLTQEDFEGQVIEYLRDKVGACTALITPEGNPIEYQRDQEQRVTQIKDWNGRAYTVDYHDNGALRSIQFPNGTQVSQQVTEFGLPSSLAIKSPYYLNQTISQFDYTYDACDRLIHSTDLQHTEDYLYDSEGRLLEVKTSDPQTAEQFIIDASGNSLQSPQGSGQYNGVDQLTRFNGTAFQYDGLGNTLEGSTANGLLHYQYNGRNQLISAQSPQGKTSYTYDALGRRLTKADSEKITTYVWAGQQLISEETKKIGGELITRRDYLYFPGSFVPLAMRENGQTYYYHCGRRGEVLAMTDQQGELVWHARYSAFGEAQINIEKVKQPWRLAGHYYDEETALHYVLARYYQPQLGRFLSKDPLFFEGGSDNFYLYCDGDPINRADPTGEFIFTAILIGAAIGAAIGGGIEAYRQHNANPEADFDWGKIATAVAIGGVIGAIGGGVGAAVEGAFAIGTAATIGGGALVGGVSGVASSVAEQCAQAALTGGSISASEVLIDGIIGAGIGAVTGGVGGWLARRAKKGVQDVAGEVVEQARRRAKKVKQKFDELKRHGHGPQRHEGDITPRQLEERAVKGIDPMSGTTKDAVTGNTHKYSRNATKVNSPEDYVKAESHIRNSKEFEKTVKLAENSGKKIIVVKESKLKEIYGSDYSSKVTGRTRVGSAKNPQGVKDTIFTDESKMVGVYKKSTDGNWQLVTMYPDP